MYKCLTILLSLFALISCGGGGSTSSNSNPPVNGAPLPKVALQPVFQNIEFNFPLALLQAPGDPNRWFVVERAGKIKAVSDSLGTFISSIFIDISARVTTTGEGGLLGAAFHPDFQRNGQVYLSYTRPGAPLTSYISRFTSPDEGQTLDPASEQPVLIVDQPFQNHNGGNIAFGPDGYLYIGLGDGGSGGDPLGNGQNTNTLLGALLRIDVDVSTPYGIPADNPFVLGGGRAEIFAWGFRNPWRWSFDRASGALWVGDVGQNDWEEIDRVERGGNYGWNIREGAHCFGSDTCDASGLIDPIVEYDHSQGCSVTGGYVYRGTAIPALVGVYIYGDFCSGRIWGLFSDEEGHPRAELLIDSDISITSFSENQAGELYVLGSEGQIFQLVADSVD
jgi:glucose/arabinose dehydrogenase